MVVTPPPIFWVPLDKSTVPRARWRTTSLYYHHLCTQGPGLSGATVAWTLHAALQFSISLGPAPSGRKLLSGSKLVTCAKWIHFLMAPEDHLVNYFHCTEYHPGVLEDGIGVTWVSYFLPEKKCTSTEGSGRCVSLRPVGYTGSGGRLAGQGKHGNRVWFLALPEVGQEGFPGTLRLILHCSLWQ